MLKPDVVFFGENVPRERVEAAMRALDEADAMLVVGSSLMVYSGYRFCERAAASGKPIAAINRGRTRADPLFALKVERRAPRRCRTPRGCGARPRSRRPRGGGGSHDFVGACSCLSGDDWLFAAIRRAGSLDTCAPTFLRFEHQRRRR